MPAAVAVPLIVGAASTAASAYAAKKQSDSAKKAAATQGASADRALAEQSRMYDTTRADLRPYMDAGTAALPSLSGLLSRSRPSFGAPSVAPVQSSSPLSLSSLSMKSVGSGQTPAAAGMVRVKAPTGEIAMLSQVAAQKAVERGAQIVG